MTGPVRASRTNDGEKIAARGKGVIRAQAGTRRQSRAEKQIQEIHSPLPESFAAELKISSVSFTRFPMSGGIVPGQQREDKTQLVVVRDRKTKFGKKTTDSTIPRLGM